LGNTVLDSDLKVAHVVMVDDDKEDLFLTKASFQQAKFPFKFTGLEGANALFNYIDDNGIEDIDILLLDLNMPITGGLEALKKLREVPEIEKIKIFMFSTSSSHVDRNECVDAGADGYLFKPSGSEEVKRFVNTISLASNFWVSN